MLSSFSSAARAPTRPALPEGLDLDRRKDYGDTAVYWLSLASDEEKH